MSNLDKLCQCILGVLIPPVLMYMNKKCGMEFWISLILFFFIVIPSIIYTFHVVGFKDLCVNVLNIFIPPVGVYLKKGCTQDFWINLILTFFLWVPGIIHAYFVTW